MRKSVLFFLVAQAATVMLSGQTTVWNPAANPSSNGNWDSIANWTNGVPAPAGTAGSKAVFNVADAMACRVTSAASAHQIVQGDNGPGDTLIVAGGGSLTTGNIWSGIGYNNPATVIVESGGSFTFGQHAWLGMNAGGVCNMDIHGTVSVTAMTGLGWSGGTGFVNVYEGGVMNCAQFNAIDGNASIKEGSVLDVRGGTVNFTGDKVNVINAYIEAGRIVGYGGGGTLNVTLDAGTTVLTSNADVTAPTVLSTDPADGATDVPNTPFIDIEFSEPMNQASVEAAISVSPAISNMAFSWNGNTVTVTGDDMAVLTLHTVTVATSALDGNDNALETEYAFSFTTVDPDAPPVVVATTPSHEAVDVDPNEDLVIIFSKAMDSASVVSALSSDPDITGFNPSFAWSSEDKILTVSMDRLAWESPYTFTVAAGAQAADATTLAADAVFSFTTMSQPKTDIIWKPADDGSSDGLWSTAANWNLGEVADGNFVVKFNQGDTLPACTLNTMVDINKIVMGDGGNGDTLIVTAGGGFTTRTESWSGIGYNNPATLIVEEGATLTFGNHFWIGMNAGGDANVYLNGGTINVGEMFGLGFQGNGTHDTLFLNSGLLNLYNFNVDQSIGVNCQLVIGGGMVQCRGNKAEGFKAYADKGNIVNGLDEGGLRITYDGVKDSTFIYIDKTAPAVAGVAPADASTDIAVDSAITIEFSEPMQRSSTEGAISVSPEITGMYFMWKGTTLSVLGDNKLNETAYTVTIGTGATDLAGNALESETIFGFTTAAIPTYTVTFNVSDASGALAGAEVTFQSATVTTDAGGVAEFTGIEAVSDAPYSVAMEGYTTVDGTLSVVDADVSEDVLMESTGVSPVSGHIRNIYPNPASDVLHIEIGSVGVETLTLVNILGQVYHTSRQLGHSEQITLDVSEFSKGLYFIRTESEGELSIRKIMIK